MKAKGLRVNMGKTKIMISGKNLHFLRDSGKHSCGVCRKGVGSNSILCYGCQLWIHKKCSGIKGKLTADLSCKCKRCKGICRPTDGRPENLFVILLVSYVLVVVVNQLLLQEQKQSGESFVNFFLFFLPQQYHQQGVECCLIVAQEGLYFMQVNVGLFREKIFSIYSEMNGPCCTRW